MPCAADEPIPPQIIAEALNRVLTSRGFRGSAQRCRFLQFIVQETLAGHAKRIKAYTIAVDVLDRDESFDPLLDPVVRIQASRVRRCLEQYYLREGATDPIRITIPKGTYVPHFTVSDGAADAEGAPEHDEQPLATGKSEEHPPEEAPTWLSFFRAARSPCLALFAVAVLAVVSCLLFVAMWTTTRAPPLPHVEGLQSVTVPGPSLLVLPFANGTGDPGLDLFAEGFTESLIGALIRFRNLLVFDADTTIAYRSAPALHEAEPGISIDYVLKGRFSRAGEQLQITVSLISAKDRHYLWSDSFRGNIDPATLMDLRQDIAVQVARALAQPNGVIYAEKVGGSATQPPKAPSSYECMLRTGHH